MPSVIQHVCADSYGGIRLTHRIEWIFGIGISKQSLYLMKKIALYGRHIYCLSSIHNHSKHGVQHNDVKSQVKFLS